MGEFWNPEFATMSWPRLQEYWLGKFNQLVEHATAASAFYRERLRDRGPARSFEDLARFPVMTKGDIREAQLSSDRGNPLGGIQVASTDEIVQVISSSGTTGRPAYYGVTRDDVEMWREAMASYFFNAGIRRTDTIAHVTATAMFAGGEPYFNGLRHIGALTVWTGGFTTQKVLETIRNLHCNAVLATPSFHLFLAESCKQMLGIECRDLGVKKVLGGGEPGMGEESIRRRIQEAWGAESVREVMGLADVMPGMWSECEQEDGMHFTAQPYVMVELVDPDTGRHLPWEPGVRGEPVYTTLLRKATPLVRYASRDYVRVEGIGCSCGMTSPKMRCIGRVDDMLIYKAMNVFPSAIRDVVVTAFERELTGHIQVVKQHASQVRFDDPIPVDIEVRAATRDAGTLKREIEERVRQALTVRISANLVPPGSIERSMYKSPLVRVAAR